MDRIVGIDFGSARVGVAMSDPLCIFASPLETVPTAKIIEYLQKLASSETIVRFVLGLPLNLNGNPAQCAPEVEAFRKKLKKVFPEVPVEMEDERFTSVLAHRAMIDGGMKKSDRMNKFSVDRISAAIILQGWLDRNTRK